MEINRLKKVYEGYSSASQNNQNILDHSDVSTH